MKPEASPGGERAAWCAAAAFAVVFSALAIVKYDAFLAAVDLGIFAQALSSGSWALPDAMEGGSHFAVHFSPILYLCVPVLALARTPVALQIVQALAGALCGPAVYRIAARRLPARTAFVLAFVALAYPPLVAVTFVDFHENAFVAPLVLWLIWATLARRFRVATALAIALLCVKEDEALLLGFAAALTGARAARTGDPRLARLCLAAMTVAALTFVAYFAWLQPLAAGGRAWDPLRFYAAHGRGSADVPYASFARFGYVLEALYPLLFLPLFSRRIVYAIPGLLEDAGSRQALPFSMNSHYPAVWVPWMLAAAVDGYANLRLAPERVRSVATASLAVCTAVLLFASPTHWRHHLAWPSAHDAAVRRRIGTLPREASIATDDGLFAHLGFDPHARAGFDPARRATYLAIDETRAATSYHVPALMAAAAARDSPYALVDRTDGLAVYRLRGGAVPGVPGRSGPWNR